MGQASAGQASAVGSGLTRTRQLNEDRIGVHSARGRLGTHQERSRNPPYQTQHHLKTGLGRHCQSENGTIFRRKRKRRLGLAAVF